MFSRNFIGGLLILIFMSCAAFLIKYSDLKQNHGVENIQATYHALLTINSLSSLPFSESALLPTVNYNSNKNIPWAAAVKTIDGNYVYTSFPSLGFVTPYLTLRIFNASLTLKNLFIFNSALWILTTITFFTTLYLVMSSVENDVLRTVSSLAGCSVLIFSCESLVSSGVIYWPHALSQLIMAITLLLFVIRNHTNKRTVDVLIFLALLSFSMTEWTGYVLSSLLVLYLIITKPEDWKRISCICVSSSLLALLIFAIQIEMVISLGDFLQTSLERFSTRSASKASLTSLLEGYWVSFGIYLTFLVPVFIYLKDRKYRFLLTLCALPMFENFILAQHATAFTFDRWKLAFLIGTSIALICSKGGSRKIIAITLAIVSAVFGVWKYQSKVEAFSPWTSADKKNRELTAAALKITDTGCTEIFSDTRVRGYPVILFMQSVHEGMPTHPLDVMKSNSTVCSVIILHGTMPTPDMPEYSSVEVWKKGEDTPHIFN